MPTRKSQRLTQKVLSSVKVPAGKRKGVWLWDDLVPGFGARVFPSGTVSYAFNYRNKEGKQERKSLGKGTYITIAQARELAAQERSRVIKGECPQTQKEKIKNSPTLGEIAQKYLASRRSEVKSHSLKEESRIISSGDLTRIMKLRILALDRTVIMDAIEGIKLRGKSVQANRTLSVVKRVMKYASNMGYVDSNILADARPLSRETSRSRYLNDGEIFKFWTTLDNLEGVSYHTTAALRLILLTAQRPGEVISMTWNEVDLDNALWTIPVERSKNGIENRVPLNSLALSILLELKNRPARAKSNEESTFVFPAYQGSGIDPAPHILVRSMSHFVWRNLHIFEISRFTPHDLRRTAATKLAELGYAAYVPAILNHKPQGITGQVYMLYQYDKEKRQALDALAEKVYSLVFGLIGENVIPISKRK